MSACSLPSVPPTAMKPVWQQLGRPTGSQWPRAVNERVGLAPSAAERRYAAEMSNVKTAAVREVLSRISAAWRERRYEDLEHLFAEDMVFALPGFGDRLEGRTPIVASYREFMDRIELTSYREEELDVDVWGDTAVAKYRWDMAWLARGVPNHETGHDVFVLRRSGKTWLAIWRTMTLQQKTEPAR